MIQSSRDRWVMGGGTTGLLIVASMMLFRFWDSDTPMWDGFLTTVAVGLAVAAFFLQRYFRHHIGEIGEARFDTRNKNNG